MSNDKLYRTEESEASARRSTTTAGKLPATARLSGGPRFIFRVETAEAATALAGAFGSRDDNGVAHGADAAVDRAAGSSGSSLPGDLRGRFESSLGADLSGVRVHTGGASAEAASAVGAKAYTTGNDIHFGAGHYDPQSAFGVHLLAHEVAHTVQQQGGAPTRQHKLEVSAPQDGAELEADRAAARMVAGEAATVTTQASSVARYSCTPGANDYNPGACYPGTGRDPYADQDTYYKPTNWLAKANAAAGNGTGLGAVPSPSSYVPEFETIMHPSHKPFRAVASATVATHNGLITPLTDFNEFAAKAEAADAPSGANLHPDDPGAALDNTKSSGSAMSIKDAYAADFTGIKIDKSKLHAKNMDAETHAEVKKLRDRIAGSSKAINAQQAKVVAKATAITAKIDVAIGKQAAIQIALNDTKLANLDAKKTGWKNDQGAFHDSVAIVRASIGLIGSGAAMAVPGGGGVAGGVKVAEAATDLVEAGGNAYFNAQVRSIDAQSAKIATTNKELAELGAYGEYSAARADIVSAIAELLEEDSKFEQAKKERTSLYADLAVQIDKALEKNGASKTERDAVQSSVTAIPLMEAVVSKLDGIIAASNLPGYSDDSGLGATHCTNLGEFVQVAGAVAGYHDAAKSDRVIWGKRLTAASDVTKLVR